VFTPAKNGNESCVFSGSIERLPEMSEKLVTIILRPINIPAINIPKTLLLCLRFRVVKRINNSIAGK
jgi:hypothetical protein